jgi:hypothetical protein
MATFEAVKRFMEANEFWMTSWPILSNDKYSMVEAAWKQAFDAADDQWVLEGAPLGTPSIYQVPSRPSLKIDPQTPEVESLEFCLILLFQI